MKQLALVLLCFSLVGCATVKAVDIKNKAGFEDRENDRYSEQVGLEVKTEGDYKVGAAYRHRWHEDGKHTEDGVFVDVTIPLYRKK